MALYSLLHHLDGFARTVSEKSPCCLLAGRVYRAPSWCPERQLRGGSVAPGAQGRRQLGLWGGRQDHISRTLFCTIISYNLTWGVCLACNKIKKFTMSSSYLIRTQIGLFWELCQLLSKVSGVGNLHIRLKSWIGLGRFSTHMQISRQWSKLLASHTWFFKPNLQLDHNMHTHNRVLLQVGWAGVSHS